MWVSPLHSKIYWRKSPICLVFGTQCLLNKYLLNDLMNKGIYTNELHCNKKKFHDQNWKLGSLKFHSPSQYQKKGFK